MLRIKLAYNVGRLQELLSS